MRTITLAVLVGLAAASFAASSPEFAVGGTETVATPHGRWYPSVASDGDGFFAVWSDYRASAFLSVVGSRISASGEILDPHGIILGYGGNAESPHVVWDGGAYQVVWTQITYPGFRRKARIMGARVAHDGRVLSAARVLMEDASTGGRSFAASNDNVTVIGFVRDALTKGEVRALVLDRNGNPAHLLVLADESIAREDVTVATSGSDFLLAWTSRPANDPLIEVTTLDANGQPLAKEVRVIGDGSSPRIASNGNDEYVLVARREVGTPSWVGRIVTADLAVSDTCVFPSDRALHEPSVMYRNGQYDFIAWDPQAKPQDALLATRLDPRGCPAGGLQELGTLGTELDNSFLATATNGREVLAVWSAWREISGVSRFDIQARVYGGQSLAPATPDLLLSRAANLQQAPSIASGGGHQLVAWTEADYSVRATRIGTNGQSLDGRGMRLSTRLANSAPRVAFDGGFYVVAWAETDRIALRWIDPATGAVVTERTLPAQFPAAVALAATPQATFVAWTDDGHEVRLMRIPNDTRTPDPAALRVSPDDDRQYGEPALSWNGTTLLLAWTEFTVVHSDPPYTIHLKVLGARVTPQLTLLDPAPLRIGDVPDADVGPPSVASNGTDWLVVWPRPGAGIAARRVLHDGRLEDNEPALLAAGMLPSVAWDGSRYALVWQDVGVNNLEYRQRALRLGTIPSTGPLGVTFGTAIAAVDTYPGHPAALARIADGRMAVVYTRTSFVREHGGVERAFVRFMDPEGLRKRRGPD